jgi:hypothetical protein
MSLLADVNKSKLFRTFRLQPDVEAVGQLNTHVAVIRILIQLSYMYKSVEKVPVFSGLFLRTYFYKLRCFSAGPLLPRRVARSSLLGR